MRRIRVQRVKMEEDEISTLLVSLRFSSQSLSPTSSTASFLGGRLKGQTNLSLQHIFPLLSRLQRRGVEQVVAQLQKTSHS